VKRPLRETLVARRLVRLVEALLDVPEETLLAMARDFQEHGTDRGQAVDVLVHDVLRLAAGDRQDRPGLEE
jgi:hypothetical protein